MRATPRITWLLLSLGFLFDSVHSVDSQTTAPVAITHSSGNKVTPATQGLPSVITTAKVPGTANSAPANAVTVVTMTAAPPTVKDNPTQKPPDPTHQPPDPVITVSVAKTAATDKAATAGPPTTVAPPNHQAGPATTQGPPPSAGTIVAQLATTAGSPNAVTVAVTTASGRGTGPSAGAATEKTTQTVVPGKNPDVTNGPPVVPHSNAVTPTVPTDVLTTEQGGKGHVIVTTTATPGPTNPRGDALTPRPTAVPPATSGTLPPGPTDQPKSPGTSPSTLGPLKPTVPLDPAAGTTPAQSTAVVTTTTTTTTTVITTSATPKKFIYSLLSEQESKEEEELAEVCKRLMPNWQNGTCTLTWRHHNGKVQFDLVEINGKVKTSLATQLYEEITKKPTDNRTLIIILVSCGALLIMIVILAVCASHHRKPYNENQQHLTEELHTVENGYHDNPTLEVMEVQPEMQEKKLALNGEFNDSWIVPFDNLLKDDIPDEEDTHL